MLSWFVGWDAAESALTGHILTEKDVKINPACLDENISMHRIKCYFPQPTQRKTEKVVWPHETRWKTVLSTWEKVVSLGWRCGICKKELDRDQIGCDGCLLW